MATIDIMSTVIPSAFHEYFNESMNNQCVDCSIKNPDWCSLQFGVLICLECAGKHRSLGVHITAVKSISLDRWEPKQFLYLKHGGNKAFSEYLGDKVFASNTAKYKNKEVLYYREILLAKVETRNPREITDPVIEQLIIQAQQTNVKSPSRSPDWIPDMNSDACMVCSNGFTLLRRRHHCRRCGKLVCADCAPFNNSRPILEWDLKEPVRHCKLCYKSPNIHWSA